MTGRRVRVRGRMEPLFRLLAAAALSSVPSSAAALFQDPASAAVRDAAPDSAELLDRARDAQRSFERRRVRHLPVTMGWGGGECDDQVGRMCWRHDTGGHWTPEPDAPAIVEARTQLLGTLEEVAREISGDRWVLGQRVWYTGEAGRWEDALSLARACGPPDRWWCAALEGLALHRLERYEASAARFEAALRLMEPERAAAWRNPAKLLDGDGTDALDRARDAGREEAFLRRLWSWSDPLWTVAGNDRLTEHHARRTVAELRADARTPYGITWGSDLEELLVRYGWEVGWERISSSPASILDRQGVVGHEHPASRSFVPPGRVLRGPVEAPPEAWIPGLAYARSAYAPAYAPIFLPAFSVVSVVPLGDTAAVLATWRLPADTTYRTRRGLRAAPDPAAAEGAGSVEAGLALRDSDGEPVGEVRGGGPEGGLMTIVPAGRYVASVEALDRAAGVAGRHRGGIEVPVAPPDVATLSDLLLLEDGPEPETLEDVPPRLLTGPSLPPDGAVRVAWVVAGLGLRDETLSYRLSVRDTDRGLLRRAGEWLGLVDRDEPLRLIWEEPAPGGLQPRLRSVRVTLPDLEPGTNVVLRLELQTRGRQSVVSERRVVIGDPTEAAEHDRSRRR